MKKLQVFLLRSMLQAFFCYVKEQIRPVPYQHFGKNRLPSIEWKLSVHIQISTRVMLVSTKNRKIAQRIIHPIRLQTISRNEGGYKSHPIELYSHSRRI